MTGPAGLRTVTALLTQWNPPTGWRGFVRGLVLSALVLILVNFFLGVVTLSAVQVQLMPDYFAIRANWVLTFGGMSGLAWLGRRSTSFVLGIGLGLVLPFVCFAAFLLLGGFGID